VLQKEPNLYALPAIDAPESVRIACQNSFADDNQAALCIRTSMGGLALSRLLADLGGARTEDEMPFFTTPDISQVDQTNDEHPKAQCRLDTYYNGSLCPVDFKKNTDSVDPLINTCSQEKGDTVGFRPRCWYAPKTDRRTRGNRNPKGSTHGRYY
jgi:hypothetical protein